MSTTHADPLLDPQDLGVPRFSAFTVSDLRPACEEAFAAAWADIEKIGASDVAPTVENTVVATEVATKRLNRLCQIVYNLSATDTSDEMRATQAWLSEELASFASRVARQQDLAQRIKTLADSADDAGLREDERRLVESALRKMKHTGSYLPSAEAEELAEIDARLAELSTTFADNLMAESLAAAVHFTDEATVRGLSASDVDVAAQAAKDKDLPGWLITMSMPSSQPCMAELADPQARRAIAASSRSRGRSGTDTDTTALALEIVRRRARRAELLGYKNHAEYVLSEQTAPSVEAVEDLLRAVAGPVADKIATDGKVLAERAERDGLTEFSAADYEYYEQVLAAESDAGVSDLRPYFERDRVLVDGILHAATRLYGLQFTFRDDIVAYHEDVQVLEVTDADSTPVGCVLLDWFARDSKRSGAWMSHFVLQSGLWGDRPVIAFNCNVRKPAPGKPVLLTEDEVATAFHEFGHVLHGLLSDVRYASQAGTSVPRDFVEFPSQVNEMWRHEPEVLGRYAVHHETGEPMPAELMAEYAQQCSTTSVRGTAELVAAAVLDWSWHTLSSAEAEAVTDIDAFEADVFARWGLPVDLVPPRYESRYFAHIFSLGYSAGYYSYMWAEVLDADTVTWIKASTDVAATGAALREHVLSVGDSVDPMPAVERMLGRPVSTQPYLRRLQVAD